MVTDTGKILHAAAAHQDNGVLLEVVAFAADVSDDFLTVGETNLGDLAKRGVRLLRGASHHLNANAAALRTIHKGG